MATPQDTVIGCMQRWPDWSLATPQDAVIGCMQIRGATPQDAVMGCMQIRGGLHPSGCCNGLRAEVA